MTLFKGQADKIIQTNLCRTTVRTTEPAYKKLTFSKQAGQFLMKTLNFDKQAERFLITPFKKLKNINVIDITGHDVPYRY